MEYDKITCVNIQGIPSKNFNGNTEEIASAIKSFLKTKDLRDGWCHEWHFELNEHLASVLPDNTFIVRVRDNAKYDDKHDVYTFHIINRPEELTNWSSKGTSEIKLGDYAFFDNFRTDYKGVSNRKLTINKCDFNKKLHLDWDLLDGQKGPFITKHREKLGHYVTFDSVTVKMPSGESKVFDLNRSMYADEFMYNCSDKNDASFSMHANIGLEEIPEGEHIEHMAQASIMYALNRNEIETVCSEEIESITITFQIDDLGKWNEEYMCSSVIDNIRLRMMQRLGRLPFIVEKDLYHEMRIWRDLITREYIRDNNLLVKFTKKHIEVLTRKLGIHLYTISEDCDDYDFADSDVKSEHDARVYFVKEIMNKLVIDLIHDELEQQGNVHRYITKANAREIVSIVTPPYDVNKFNYIDDSPVTTAAKFIGNFMCIDATDVEARIYELIRKNMDFYTVEDGWYMAEITKESYIEIRKSLGFYKKSELQEKYN